MECIDRRLILAGAGLAGVAAVSRLTKAGPLDPPPGPVSPTGRTLQETYDKVARSAAGMAEPRIPIESLPGDATALHVIDQPGSYYLTGNLLGESGKNGVVIATDGVCVDLRGFEVRGTPGALDGIRTTGYRRGIAIHNGSATGWRTGFQMFDVSDGCVFENLRSYGNSSDGFSARFGSVLSRCAASENGSHGFFVHLCHVEACTAIHNNLDGIQMCCGGQIVNCSVWNNGASGIVADDGCRVDGNSAFGNTGIGILALQDCAVTNNIVRNGAGAGIVLQGSRNRAEGNQVLRGHIGISVTGTGNIVLRNTVREAATAYAIGPGNTYGPLVMVSGVGPLGTSANQDHPWANFLF